MVTVRDSQETRKWYFVVVIVEQIEAGEMTSNIRLLINNR